MKKRAALLLAPALLALGGLAAAHYPMLITEDSEVEPGKPLEIVYQNGHPWMNDRYEPAAPTKVGVYLPGRRFFNLMKKVTKQEQEGKPTSWKLKYTPKHSGDFIFSWHCGVYQEPDGTRRVADYAKLVLHVKDEEGAQVGWRRILGDPLEIVPLTRPYAIPVGAAFRGRVVWNLPTSKTRFKTNPWIKGVVDAETYTPDKSHGDTYLPHNRLGVETDKDGTFVVSLPAPGWWLLSCATDGGPGEQGAQRGIAKRAVLWVKVGGTVFDRPFKPVKPGEKPKHGHKHGSLLPEAERGEARHAAAPRPAPPRVAVRAVAEPAAAEVRPAESTEADGYGRWLAVAFVLVLAGGLVGAATRP